MMKKALLLTTILLGFLAPDIQAQTAKSTYLYLEVNKELPVSIKLNDRKVRNDRKGYVIIPKLAEGENVLEFNFANPNFRKHSFKIDNTNKRSMGLNLLRVSGNRFVLQDVVSKKMINDETMLNTKPIVVASASKDEKTAPPKRGIVKVYEAEKEEPVVAVKTAKTPTTTTAVAASNTVTQTPVRKPRELAMYKNRKPLTVENKANRYKNYSKAKRAKKRAARLNNKNSEPVNVIQEKKPVIVKTKEVKPVVKRPIADLKAEKERKKELEKEAKRIAREKKIKENQEKERLEYERLERERNLRKEKRLAKKKERTEEIADVVETKKKEVLTKRKKKNYEKEFPNIDEKVINAEPTGNRSAKNDRKKYNDESEASPIRCKNSVQADKVAEWSQKLHKKFDDEARGNYIRKKLGSKCITTNNLGIVLGNLETQIGRYKLIRMLYPNIEDPANIDRFDKYFQSKSFISKLKELKLSNY